MTILVTGATGHVGSHLINELKKTETVVSLLHTCPRGPWQKEALEGTVKVTEDIRNHRGIKAIMARYYVDKVYHLAALAEVKSAYKDPVSTYAVNVMGAVSVLEAAKDLNIEKTLLLITDKVYGEKEGAKETSRLQASEPYATSKICQQYIAESYQYTFPDMAIVFPHSCNIFGYDPYANRIFPNVIRNCIRKKHPKVFVDDESIREYIHVDDVVRALISLMESHKIGSYNISTGWIHDNGGIVTEILKHFPHLKAVNTNLANHTREAFGSKKLPKQIQRQTMVSSRWNFTPELMWEDAVEMTVHAFQKRRPEWDKGR